MAEIMLYMEAMYGPSTALRPDAAPSPGTAGIKQVPYETLFIEAGKTIIAYAGTEMILRGGSAVAVTGVNGLCNVTIGVDVLDGEIVQYNHLLITPRSDGRGMRFLADSYLMVKGDYIILD
jgi:hypothetical protein